MIARVVRKFAMFIVVRKFAMFIVILILHTAIGI